MKILFRYTNDDIEEVDIAAKYFNIATDRTECWNELVIGRYSCLPYYNEVERDLKNLGCELINSYKQHLYIANFDYYNDLKEFTPDTWFDYNFYKAPEGRYIVKGRTNSRKNKWNKLCYADSKLRAIEIGCELAGDPLIGPQGIIYRKYIPLKTFSYDLSGIPTSNEWRCFIYKDKILSIGYYWSNATDEDKSKATFEGMPLLRKLIDILKDKINFYVLDLAETESGEWILVEMNDGQQSGLSDNNAEIFYRKLYECISNRT